jgi:hypothetical protein
MLRFTWMISRQSSNKDFLVLTALGWLHLTTLSLDSLLALGQSLLACLGSSEFDKSEATRTSSGAIDLDLSLSDFTELREVLLQVLVGNFGCNAPDKNLAEKRGE